jgi:hypothetical protein
LLPYTLYDFLQYEEIRHLDEWQRILSIKAMKEIRKASLSYGKGIKLLWINLILQQGMGEGILLLWLSERYRSTSA